MISTTTESITPKKAATYLEQRNGYQRNIGTLFAELYPLPEEHP